MLLLVWQVPVETIPSVHSSIPDPVWLITTGRPLARFRSNVGACVVGDIVGHNVGFTVGFTVGCDVDVGPCVGLRLDGDAVVE